MRSSWTQPHAIADPYEPSKRCFARRNSSSVSRPEARTEASFSSSASTPEARRDAGFSSSEYRLLSLRGGDEATRSCLAALSMALSISMYGLYSFRHFFEIRRQFVTLIARSVDLDDPVD